MKRAKQNDDGIRLGTVDGGWQRGPRPRLAQLRSQVALYALRVGFGVFLTLCAWLVLATVVLPRLGADGRILTSEDFGIRAYVSDRDADSDGTDDQTDILQSAKDYVATRPTYRSDYFHGGWPTDGTGVCTDVIAYALLGAGYDLPSLVDADIRADAQARRDGTGEAHHYDVERTDPNIDYRRVRNLKVFFDRHATNLTCDINDISEWQGGDIVCYDDHIGIVSDRRNSDGVPYIIHHGSPWQSSYEENRLGDWGSPERHWRWDRHEGNQS